MHEVYDELIKWTRHTSVRTHSWCYDITGGFYVCFPARSRSECKGCGVRIPEAVLDELPEEKLPIVVGERTQATDKIILRTLDWLASVQE